MYRELGEELKKILKLEREPVAIKWLSRPPRNVPKEEGKSRFCQKLEKAMNGETFYSTSDEEECMGGMRYSGLKDPREFPKNMQTGSFLVGGGVFKNMPSVRRAWKRNLAMEPELFEAVEFAPLTESEFDPDVVFIVCNAKQGMELLHANAYDAGAESRGADMGPICSSMAAVPYLTGQLTYGFGEIGARNNMNLKDNDVMVSIPASELGRIVSNLQEMKTKTFFKEH
jgi:uncharacterized protein (DUF169 family)